MIINGIEITLENLLEYKAICSKVIENNEKKKTFGINTPRKTSLGNDDELFQLLSYVININTALLTSDPKERNFWWGSILMPEEDEHKKTWKERYCSIEAGKLTVFCGTKENPGEVLAIHPFIDQNISYQIYSASSCHFTVVHCETDKKGLLL